MTPHVQLLKRLPTWIYKLGAQAYIDKEFPRHIFIETTAACNLSCTYCPREKSKDHMEWETFQKIVDEATEHGPRSFSLHLFGEPLLYPRWFEAIGYIKHRNKRNTVLLTTNGTMLEKGNNLSLLINSGVDKVLWSWRPEVKFSERTRERLREWGKFTVRIIKELVPKEEIEKWKDWKPYEERNLHNYGGEISLENFGAKSTDGKRHPCYHLWYAPAVAWNGNLLACCADSHQKFVIGNIKEMTISEAWKSRKMEDERKNHLNGVYKGICENCDIWKQYPDIFFESQKGS